jgi:serine/threonine protein kinase/Flp pilus assembly protein TadD
MSFTVVTLSITEFYLFPIGFRGKHMASENGYIGKQIGNYRVISKLADGAYGSVYQAQHIILTERTVAIKLIHASLGSEQEHDRFLQEARLLEKLKHPHILPIYDVGIHEGFPYLVVEYAQHGSLRDRLNRQLLHPLQLKEAVNILSQVGQALHHAHQQNIIHRDLKPENILFNAKDEPLLADFGIAVVLSTAGVERTKIVGTPYYMAPEQFLGMVGKESDQYALGCIAYELFTGQEPFTAPDFFALGVKHRLETPVPPTQLNPRLPTDIEQVILKTMAKQGNERFTDISDFITALCAVPISLTSEEQVPVDNFLPRRLLPLSYQDLRPTWKGENPSGEFRPTVEINKCPVCHAEARPGDKFCLNCGNSLSQIISLAPLTPKCPYCGAETRWGDNFCLNCSKRLPSPTQPAPGESRFMPTLLGPFPTEPNLPTAAPSDPAPDEDTVMSLRPQLLDASSTLAFEESKEQWLAQARIHYKNKRYEAALAAYKRVLQRYPQEARAYTGQGKVLQRLRRNKEALVVYEQALEIIPDDAEIWSTKGEVLCKLKRYDEAVDAYEHALTLNPNDTLTWAAKGHLLYKLERYDEALVAYEHVLTLSPTKALIWASKGEVLCKLKRYDEALDAYNRALILNPNDASLSNKCELLRVLKNHQEELADPRKKMTTLEASASLEEKLQELDRLKQAKLIDDDVAAEYQRRILERFWLL